MNKVVEVFHGRRVIALALAGAAGALLAGCSSDVSGFNPFQNSARFDGGTDRTPTGTILPPAPVGQGSQPVPMVSAAPTTAVASAPLAPVRTIPQTSYAPQPSYTPRASYAAQPAPIYSGASRVASAPISHSGSVYRTDHGVWSADGGTMIVVHPGENAATIATRYNVPLEALTHVNGLVSVAQVHPGARIVIPVYSATNGVHDRSAMMETRPSATRVETARAEPTRLPEPGRRQVASAEPKGRETFHFVKGPSGAPPDVKQARGADRQTGRLAKAEPLSSGVARKPVVEAKLQPLPQSGGRGLSSPAKSKSDIDPTATASLPPAGVEAETGSHDAFRWPVRGRIIEGFRQGSNEGINIAVPDGTNVKAADDGVVAYAGSELKGYGNLVLIRHPNGFVTAYANNGEIDVKRGQIVKRGQVIAKSGASGNVSSPQLHFELRKGQTPVDPTTYLAGS